MSPQLVLASGSPRRAHILETLGRIGDTRPEVVSIDLNPLILSGSEPVVVDALVEIEGEQG